MGASRRHFTRLLGFLRSLRLATILILLLIAACVAGGVIPQSPATPDAEALYRTYGLFWYRVILRLKLDDVFGSAWFFSLSSLFAFNLLLCMAQRLRGSLRHAFGPANFGEPFCEASKATILKHRSLEALDRSMSGAIRRAGFGRVDRCGAPEGSIQVVGRRRRLGALGADVVHVGVLVILLGALLGFFREEGSFRITELEIGMRLAACGDSSGGDCVPMPYDVQVDGFGVETYQGTSQIKDYWADVILWDGEDVVEQAGISVNRPLTVSGTGLYVWRLGEDPRAALLRIQIIDTKRNIVTSEVKLRMGETVPIPGSLEQLTAVQYYQSYEPSGTTAAVDHAGESGGTSAALLQVTRLSEGGEETVARHLALPFLREPEAEQEIAFLLAEAHLPTYIDLHVTRNPGYPFFWWGFILVIAGLTVAFYLGPSTVRVAIEADHVRICAERRRDSRRAKRLARDLASLHGLDMQEEVS